LPARFGEFGSRFLVVSKLVSIVIVSVFGLFLQAKMNQNRNAEVKIIFKDFIVFYLGVQTNLKIIQCYSNLLPNFVKN
jgi:hypothetical protein